MVLNSKIEVYQSGISGKGLRATEKIAKGEVVSAPLSVVLVNTRRKCNKPIHKLHAVDDPPLAPPAM